MTTQPSPQPERRATTIKLTIGQLEWIAKQKIHRRVSISRVIEDAIVAAGAPASDPAESAG